MSPAQSPHRPRLVPIAFVFASLLLPAVTAAAAPPALRPTVNVDPRVELCSIIFRLAGFNEYTQGKIPSYLADVDAHFGPHRDHAAVALAQQLRRERGVSYDAGMAFAIHLDGVDPPRPRSPLDDRSLRLYHDGRWTPEHAAAFARAVAEFAAAADFQSFYRAHQEVYDLATQRMAALIDEHMRLEWFGRFYGVEPEAPFTIIPALVNGPANYGPKYVAPAGGEHLYAIIGVGETDAAGRPYYDRGVLYTVVHEFNHSFVNHLVDAHRADLAASGEQIMPAVAGAMRRQAYSNWTTVMYESIVRAAVVRYVAAYEGREAAEAETHRQIERSFVWTAELVELLGEYEAHRERWPTLESFMPRIVAFFGEYAPTLEGRIAERERDLEAKRPRIVSIVPPRGTMQVDPALDGIVITFDRPMAGGYQCMNSERGPFPPTPDGAKPSWNEDRTVFTLPVKLEPDTAYALTLNTEAGGSFRCAKTQAPLTMTEIWFRTGAREGR